MATQDRARFVNVATGEMFIFDSVKAIEDYIDPTLYDFKDQSFVFGRSGDGREIRSWHDFKAFAAQSWERGYRVFQEFVTRLTDAALPDVKSKKRKTTYGEEGDDVDFERMRQGEAFYKKTEREDSMGVTTMTIIIDTTTPGCVASDDILWRGAVAIALAKVLEEKGWSVEIWVVNGSTLYDDEDTSVYTSCCLKRCTDPLDTSTLINTISGWFYRTGIFTLLRTICAKRGKKPDDGLGYPQTPTDEDLDTLSTDPIRLYSAGVFTFDGALSLIQDQLEKIRQAAADDKPPTV